MFRHSVVIGFGLWAALAGLAAGRTWTDSSGHYKTEADLVAFNETTVVLKKEDRQLVAVPLDKLSKEDQEYLKAKDTADQARKAADAMQTWTLANGTKIVGRVVDYARRDITIQRRRGRIYVNDRRYDNLPEFYQKLLPQIVAHFEKVEIADRRALEAWVLRLRGEPRTFTCEGVLLELENGDEYGVPFFFLSAEDLKILQPGWERWLAGEKDRARQEQEAFLLQAEAQAYQQDRMIKEQIAVMQLQMQAFQAGLFDLWEVRLFPGRGVAGPPLMVVVPARDSRSAAMQAVQLNPGYVAGPVARVSRKF